MSEVLAIVAALVFIAGIIAKDITVLLLACFIMLGAIWYRLDER
jgi:hypothetical protein